MKAKFCLECGAPLPKTVAGGLCASCALRGALGLEGAETPTLPNPDGTEPACATPPLERGQRIGDYLLLDEIARGGMGVVYRARQITLGRIVAVKMLLPGLSSPEYLRRFRAEASAAAGLQHPHIVAIHEVGAWQGQQFLVMDYVEGQNLARVIADIGFRISDFRRSARWMKAISEAVHYAHEHGILHRDLKPSNVLIDKLNQPWVTDFGLAKRFEDDSHLTLSGQVLGSPSYMPPEQAEAQRGRVSRRSDVYGLGATLYHVLTGRAPFQGETPTEVLRQVLNQEPVAPRLLNPGIPRDLETICLKCLEKEPARRYATSQRVADELGRFLEDRPIAARPISTAEKVWRWGRRKPAVAALAVGLIGSLGLGIAGVLWQWWRAEISLERSERERYTANVALVRNLLQQKKFQDAHELLADPSLARFRGWEWGWLLRLCHRDLMTFSHLGVGNTSAFLPVDNKLATAGLHNELRIWDLETGQLQRVIQSEQGIRWPVFSPDQRRLVTITWGEPACVWEVAQGRILFRLKESSPRRQACFSPDGKIIATGDSDGKVRLFDAATGVFLGRSQSYGAAEVIPAFSSDGRFIAFAGGELEMDSAAMDTSIRIWELASDRVTVLGNHGSSVTRLAFSPDGRLLASAGWEDLKLWECATQREIPRLERPKGILRVFGLAFSPDGRKLAAAGLLGTTPWAQIFDVTSGAALMSLDGHSQYVLSIAFSPDGSRIATSSNDGTTKVWPGAGLSNTSSLEGHDAPVWAVSCSGDGRRLATGSLDQTVKIWDFATRALLNSLPVGFPVVSLALNHDGTKVISPSRNQTATVWEVASGEALLHLRDHSGTVMAVAWSRDGQWLVTAGKDHTARLWEAATGAAVRTYQGHTDWILAVAISPDGRRLVTGGADRTARLWELATGRQLRILGEHQDAVLSVAFSPDGMKIATGADRKDRMVRIWKAQTGAVLWKQPGHLDGVSSVSFSADGARLASAAGGPELLSTRNFDPSVIIWDVETARDVFRFEWVHTNKVYAVAFSPDGSHLVSGGGDHTARILTAFPWRTEDGPQSDSETLAEEIETYKRRHWRELLGDPDAASFPVPARTNLLVMTGMVNLPCEPVSKVVPPPDRPARDPALGAAQIDLSGLYNAALDETWQPPTGLADVDLRLSDLTGGMRNFGGVWFDVRGIVQLRRAAPNWCRGWFAYPETVKIELGARMFHRLHVLHATAFADRPGTVIGAYLLHYADGAQHRLEIICGRDLADWIASRDSGPESAKPSRAAVAWTAESPSGDGRWLRLFHRTYENPRPDQAVVSIEFSSAMAKSGPFLVAMTVK